MANSKQEPKPWCDSDSEDSSSRWGIRRIEASDDDDGGKEGEERPVRTGKRSVFGFDDELDGVGGPPDNEDKHDKEVLYSYEPEALLETKEVDEGFGRGEEELKEDEDEEQVAEEEKEKEKEKKALTVPRTGAFYMHDDRFRGRGRGRRKNFGRRNFWESKDERKWLHDKFEEMILLNSVNKKFNAYAKVQRSSYGHNRGYYGSQRRDPDDEVNQFKPIDKNNSQGHSSRIVRGRGPVKYKPLKSSNDVDPPGNKKSRKAPVMIADSARELSHTSKVDSDSLASKEMHHHASFSEPGISVAKKRDVQPTKTEGCFPTTIFPGNDTCIPNFSVHMQGKSIDDSIERNRLNAQESIRPVVEHHYTSLPLQSSVNMYPVQSSQFSSQARDCPLPALMIHQSPTSSSGFDRFSMFHHVVQQTPFGSTDCCPFQAYAQQLSSHYGYGILSQAPPKAPTLNGSDFGVMESFAKLSTSEIEWPGIGNDIVQGWGRGSRFGETCLHQNFATTTPLLAAMQFRDQHLGDLREHAVDKAVTRCMVQPQVGVGNSETSWLPILPAKAEGLAPLYVTPSGGSYASSLGQNSSTGIASVGASVSRLNEGSEGRDGTEFVDDHYGQRIKPRRYSKMKFNH